MASLQQKGNGWYCQFLYHGKRYTFTLGKVSQEEAETRASHVDYLLLRLKQRLATISPGVSIIDYVQFDGKLEQLPQADHITLASLRDRYLATHELSLEDSTVVGIRQHFGHIVRHLGEKFPIAELSLADLQGYVDHRSKAKGRNGRKLSPATTFKELVTLRTAWNWAVRMKLVAGKFPNSGLRFPKTTEKPPFMTRAEIERRIASSKLSTAETADLWAALYLTVPETTELLEHVKTNAIQPFIYPMLCFAAHTGARRSEIIRTKIADVDFAGKVVTIHERKRVRGKMTTRRVPLSGFLIAVLKDWLAIHPGGPYLFCQAATVPRSKTRSPTTGHKGEKTRATSPKARAAGVKLRPQPASSPITPKEAHDHLDRVLDGSKWEVVKGYHLFRHGFISALASSGIDQRLIAEFAGHMSEEQQRRYRHLYPSVKEQAITSVFG